LSGHFDEESYMVGLLIPQGGNDRDVQNGKTIDRLVRALTWVSLSAVYTGTHGPALETALPIARDHGLDVSLRPALDVTGESLADCQDRIVTELMMLARTHPGEIIAVVTNDELIRCALMAFGGAGFQDVAAIEITPTHVSSIGFEPGICRVLGVNMTPEEIAV
jgi:broad specificity phosphatase PhoE